MKIIRTQLWNKLIHCRSPFFTRSMQTVLENIDHAIQTASKILKDDNTSTVVLVKIDGQDFVIKRSNTKSRRHFYLRLISLSRARRNWKYAQKLHKIGINTIDPIAFVEERFGPLKKRSYFMYPYIEGSDLHHYFAKKRPIQPEWTEAVKAIAEMFEKLAVHGLNHRDLNLSNILLVNHQPYLIDLDSMRHFPWYTSVLKGKLRERARFMRHWQKASVSEEVHALFQNMFKALDEVHSFIK